MRSVWSKLDSLAQDMDERNADFAILSEVWEKKENLKHQYKIEELFEMKETKYISTARPGTKRGGGAAIVAREDKFNLSKLNIDIPKPLEVVWGLLRPKIPVGHIRKIIICSFYSPPKSRKKSALIDHISITLNKLRTIHPNVAVIIAGDKNDLDERGILSICPSLRQIVLKPTRKNKTLDIVITDLHRYYTEPSIVPPVPVDDVALGVPSDHDGVLVLPLTNSSSNSKTKTIKTIRPIKQSSLDNFGQNIVLEDWSFLEKEASSTSLVQTFQDHCGDLVDHYFPTKTILVTPYDKPWFSDKLKLLRRKRQRVYRREGKTEKYLKIKDDFDQSLRIAALKYKNKVTAEVIEGKRGSAYKALRKLGSTTAEAVSSFYLPSHMDMNLSAQQSANILADHFSKISQEFEPIDPNKFSAGLKAKLASCDEEIPVLEEHLLYQKINSAKKPNSCVPGDLPKQLVCNFAVELALPVTYIFNTITQSAVYPSRTEQTGLVEARTSQYSKSTSRLEERAEHWTRRCCRSPGASGLSHDSWQVGELDLWKWAKSLSVRYLPERNFNWIIALLIS